MQAPKIILINFLIESGTLFDTGLKKTYYTLLKNLVIIHILRIMDG